MSVDLNDPSQLRAQVERNRHHAQRANQKFKVLAVLTFVLVMILAYRTEVNANNVKNIQYKACLGDVGVLSRFNMQQDSLALAEQRIIDVSINTREVNKVRRDKILIYKGARILPLPVCTKS